MTKSTLLSILDRLERQCRVAWIRFNDGEAYQLRIISNMHAEEGGDVVAEVIRVELSPNRNAAPEGTFINFLLADVVQVTLDGECLFRCAPDA